MSQRYKLPAGGDVPAAAAARRLALSLEAFTLALPDLINRGFPHADPTTGNYCLEAIDAWRLQGRYPRFFPSDQLMPVTGARDARDVVSNRLTRLRGG
jgi:hypothetical protein